MTLDAVVSGGGPAGLACAIRLARAGLRVRLAERRRLPQNKCCGEFLHPTAVRELSLLGVVRRATSPISRLWLTAGGDTVEFRIHPESGSMPRTVLSRRLCELASREGVDILEGVSVQEIQPQETGVRIRLGKSLVEAKFLVVAEGSGSASRRMFFRPNRAARPVYGFSMRLPADLKGQVALGAVEDGYVGLCDLGGGWINLAGLLGDAAYRKILPHKPEGLERLRRELPAWADILRGTPEDIHIQAPARSDPLVDLPGPPTFWWVGDSAGMRETAFGDGIARALRQARQISEAYLAAGGDLHQAREIFKSARRQDPHRPARRILDLAGGLLRRPTLAGRTIRWGRPWIQSLCLTVTNPAGDPILRDGNA